jgi:hypothetical protein
VVKCCAEVEIALGGPLIFAGKAPTSGFRFHTDRKRDHAELLDLV